MAAGAAAVAAAAAPFASSPGTTPVGDSVTLKTRSETPEEWVCEEAAPKERGVSFWVERRGKVGCFFLKKKKKKKN